VFLVRYGKTYRVELSWVKFQIKDKAINNVQNCVSYHKIRPIMNIYLRLSPITWILTLFENKWQLTRELSFISSFILLLQRKEMIEQCAAKSTTASACFRDASHRTEVAQLVARRKDVRVKITGTVPARLEYWKDVLSYGSGWTAELPSAVFHKLPSPP
jgi:hypothetical protein